MCGIAGLISSKRNQLERERIVAGMVEALAHRGPDERAVVSGGSATFGVARLSIVDRLAGRQPMAGRFGKEHGLLAYNGEIYNFLELRKQLEREGFAFGTQSDTEVLLAAHLIWGAGVVKRLDGMFAYAFWDAPRSRLLLARDRLGIKPLYWVDFGDELAFASEAKALFRYTRLSPAPDTTSVLEFFLYGSAFSFGHLTGDRSIFARVCQLAPGHLMTWDAGSGRREAYWSLAECLGPVLTDERAAQEELEGMITSSVRRMHMGEVPVGTSLSGGLDSSLLTAAAARESEDELVSASITYSPNFDDPDVRHAILLSNHLNRQRPGSHRLEYTYLRPETYLESVDDLVLACDEPNWETRKIGLLQNYRTLARAGPTVVLTGEGADELFFGYYHRFNAFYDQAVTGPRDFGGIWEAGADWTRALLRPALTRGVIKDDLVNDLINQSVSSYLTPYWRLTGSRLRAVQCWIIQTFLPWLLKDNDRLSMAVGLEGRFPFLSNKLVSFALRLPPGWNYALEGVSREKLLLRRAASGLLPKEIWRDRVKSPLPSPEAAPYQVRLAERLALEVEKATDEVWETLDEHLVRGMTDAFRLQVRSGSGCSSRSPITHLHLGRPVVFGVPHLFAILTFLRWHGLYFNGNHVPAGAGQKAATDHE